MAKKNPKGKKNEPISHDHHHVGQAFLRGFGDAEGLIWVHDFQKGSDFLTDPRAVAFERNFYTVDLPGKRPDALEKALGRVEKATVALIKRIETEKGLRSTDDFGQLLEFISVQAVRGPDHRERMERIASDVREKMEDVLRAVYRKQVAQRGDAPPEDRWVAERLRQDAPPLTQGDHIQSMLRHHPKLRDALSDRCSVFTLLPDKPGFHLVSSDAPFTSVEYMGVDVNGAETFRWAAWTDPAARISMALSRRLLWQSVAAPQAAPGGFIDLSDDRDPEDSAEAQRWTRRQNASTTLFARFVFGSRPGPPDGINEPWRGPTQPG